MSRLRWEFVFTKESGPDNLRSLVRLTATNLEHRLRVGVCAIVDNYTWRDSRHRDLIKETMQRELDRTLETYITENFEAILLEAGRQNVDILQESQVVERPTEECCSSDFNWQYEGF